MNISFTEKQEKYISEQLATGDYQNNSEVIRDALRLHIIYREKIMNHLRQEIEKGWEGEISTRTVKDIVNSKSFIRS